MTESEMAMFLSLLDKADHANLLFSRGNTEIRFSSDRFDSKSSISMELEIAAEDTKLTMRYALPREVLRSVKKRV